MQYRQDGTTEVVSSCLCWSDCKLEQAIPQRGIRQSCGRDQSADLPASATGVGGFLLAAVLRE